MVADLTVVHRYDQRGAGGSAWTGGHTFDRHLADLVELLDGWGYDRVALIGHSYGTTLASWFCLRRPDRVAGLVCLAGPFLGDWHTAYRTVRQARRTAAQQQRLDQLAAVEPRTEEQEVEFLTLSWFTDHHDQERAWAWAAALARTRRPVNRAMNRELNAATAADPLEDHYAELADAWPAVTELIGGSGDPRPAEALLTLGRRLNRPVTIIPDAGHEPWLEAPDVFRAEFRRAVAAATEP